MHNGDDTLQQMRDDLASDLSRERYIAERDAGNYEIRQGPYALVASGTCAACLGRVNEGDPFDVKYHPTKKGGIFHTRCAPTGPQWFGVEGEE